MSEIKKPNDGADNSEKDIENHENKSEKNEQSIDKKEQNDSHRSDLQKNGSERESNNEKRAEQAREKINVSSYEKAADKLGVQKSEGLDSRLHNAHEQNSDVRGFSKYNDAMTKGIDSRVESKVYDKQNFNSFDGMKNEKAYLLANNENGQVAYLEKSSQEGKLDLSIGNTTVAVPGDKVADGIQSGKFQLVELGSMQRQPYMSQPHMHR